MNTPFVGDLVPDSKTGEAFTLGPLVTGPPCCEPVPKIRVESLSLSYGQNEVLRNISLDIYGGCITALIGPSGCGKTSLLSSINRLTDLVPGCQVQGRILREGGDIYAPGVDVHALRRDVGMIFQRPNPFPLSIRRNLALPLREHGLRNAREIDDRIERSLKDVGLWDEISDRLDAPAQALSGGQQQRLCIARALVLEPSVLLMDEPCSALDPISSAVVEDLVESLRGRYSVVIVTHNLAQARRIANYAAFFWVKDRAGTLVEFDHCKRLFESPRDERTAAYVSGARG